MSTAHPRIFLAHSHLDNEFGTRLTQDLRRVLADESAVWYDVLGGLHGGDTWWRKIAEELTDRPIFMVILSPDAMQSPWVNDEINLAWRQRHSKVGKLIIPLLYRECEVREDLSSLNVISFLSPRSYESAFNETLRALGISIQQTISVPKTPSQPEEAARGLVRQVEAAFADQDWPDVIRKADYLIKRVPEAISATIYRLQGLALLEKGEVQQAQTALETALSLVSNRQERLILLGDYTRMLAQQEQWSKVLQGAKEALRLIPNDPSWLAIQQLAQGQLARPAAMQALRLDPSQKVADLTTLNANAPSLPTEMTGQARQISFPNTLQTDIMIPAKAPSSPEQETLSIFVSHSTKDNEFATQLVQDLQHAIGKKDAVWYDAKGGLLPGDPWFRRIEEEIAARDIFLIILSPNAMNSDWVRREYDIALNENRRIIPVLYQRCTIWGYLKTIQYISFLPPKTYESALSELLTALRHSLKANRKMETS